MERIEHFEHLLEAMVKEMKIMALDLSKLTASVAALSSNADALIAQHTADQKTIADLQAQLTADQPAVDTLQAAVDAENTKVGAALPPVVAVAHVAEPAPPVA